MNKPIKYYSGPILGISLFRPKNPFIYNYNPSGSKTIKPGPDGFMYAKQILETKFVAKTTIQDGPSADELKINKWVFNGVIYPDFETFQLNVPREYIKLNKLN